MKSNTLLNKALMPILLFGLIPLGSSAQNVTAAQELTLQIVRHDVAKIRAGVEQSLKYITAYSPNEDVANQIMNDIGKTNKSYNAYANNALAASIANEVDRQMAVVTANMLEKNKPNPSLASLEQMINLFPAQDGGVFQGVMSNRLTGPIKYNEKTKAQAKAFVDLASGHALQPAQIPAEKLKEYNNRERKAYEAAQLSYNLASSVGLSNLYNDYAERIPRVGEGKKLGIPLTNPSLIEIERYLANRRLQDDNWYQNMAGTTPVGAMRESVMIQAEMRKELYELRMEVKKLVTLLSMIHVQQTRSIDAQNLERLKEQLLETESVKEIQDRGGRSYR